MDCEGVPREREEQSTLFAPLRSIETARVKGTTAVGKIRYERRGEESGYQR